jgi:hypothetical protein
VRQSFERFLLLTMIFGFLASCEGQTKNEHNPNICGTIDLRELKLPSSSQEQYQEMLSCVDNWSARLSRTSDSADLVAEAVVYGACSSVIANFSAGLKIPPPNSFDVYESQKRQALFRVLQWRAGNCKLPEE